MDRMEDFFIRQEETTLIDEAGKSTKNRIAVMDSGKVIHNGVFYLTDYSGGVPQIFGQGWEAASTSQRIAQINEAFDYGYYYFMFDRLNEMGSDTVLIVKDAPQVNPYNEDEAEAAAAAAGYEKIYDEGSQGSCHYAEDANGNDDIRTVHRLICFPDFFRALPGIV